MDDPIGDGGERGEAAYSADVLATLNDEQYVMRVHSLSPSAATAVKTDAGAISSDDANYLNRLDLVEGRWPTSLWVTTTTVRPVSRQVSCKSFRMALPVS